MALLSANNLVMSFGGPRLLDGVTFQIEAGQRVTVTLREAAFHTLDVARCMAMAARLGLLRNPPP